MSAIFFFFCFFSGYFQKRNDCSHVVTSLRTSKFPLFPKVFYHRVRVRVRVRVSTQYSFFFVNTRKFMAEPMRENSRFRAEEEATEGEDSRKGNRTWCSCAFCVNWEKQQGTGSSEQNLR